MKGGSGEGCLQGAQQVKYELQVETNGDVGRETSRGDLDPPASLYKTSRHIKVT